MLAARLAPALAVALLAVGCADKRVAECNGLVEVVNTAVQSLDRQPKPADDPTGVIGLRGLADAMDRAATSASKLALTSPELGKLSVDYQAMARDVAKAARDMAAAADAKDVPKVNASWASLEKAYNREEPLVEELNKLCQAP